MIAYESGAADTVDPLAGSYYVESLTNELERRAWEEFEKIEKIGGSLAAIETGYMQRQITESAYRYQRRVEQGEQIVVGVNRFTAQEKRLDPDPPGGRRGPGPAGRRSWPTCDAGGMRRRCRRSLAALEQAAVGRGQRDASDRRDASRRTRTLGEICDVLRGVYGEQKQSFV